MNEVNSQTKDATERKDFYITALTDAKLGASFQVTQGNKKTTLYSSLSTVKVKDTVLERVRKYFASAEFKQQVANELKLVKQALAK